MAEKPLISVYIPTRGRAQLLVRAIGSVLLQSYENLEIIVAIDGEDAATSEALGAFCSNARVRVLQLPHQRGSCAARNEAISAARGEFITGLDDDDEFLPEHLEGLVRTVQQEGVAFACTTNRLRRRAGDTVRHRFTGEVTMKMLTCENVVGNQVLAPTCYLKELAGFDPEMPAWQDYDLWIRLCERYGHGMRIDARSYVQHIEHGGERITSPDRIARAHARFVKKHAHLLDDRAMVSLDLLKHATMHQPIGLGQIGRCLRAGFYRRTLAAIASDRLPFLRAPARWVSRVR